MERTHADKSKFRICLAFVLSFLARFIPDNTKRIILLTTLYQKGAKDGVFTKFDLKGLNRNIPLVVDEKALESACMFTPTVWKDVNLKELINTMSECQEGQCIAQSDSAIIASALIERVPRWLRYGRERMLTDLQLFFYSNPIKA